MSSNQRCHSTISALLPPNPTIIEVGYGYGYTGLRLRHSNPDIRKLTGVEIFKRYHTVVKQLGIYDTVIHHDGLSLPYPNNSFHVGLAVQVIEHVTDGMKLLEELERVSSCRVIVVTPDGFHPEGGKTRDGNPASRHRGGYDFKFFEKHGYNVIYVRRSRSRIITWIKELVMILNREHGRHRDIVAYKDCKYYDQDAVICNEEPYNCPKNVRTLVRTNPVDNINSKEEAL